MSTEPKPESPAELAAEAKRLAAFVAMPGGYDKCAAAIDRLAALATIQASGQLANDFPPMGGLTECDMGDSYE